MSLLRIVIAAAALALPLTAQATDLPSRYIVDQKELKAAVAGTNLTFELYNDALCTSLISTTVIAIENVDQLSLIKPFNAKNAPKKKKTVELRATLTGAPATPSLYLKVTGTGVVPSGGACQVQAFSGSGQLLVKDGNGATVGVLEGTNGAIYNDGGALVRFPILTFGFAQSALQTHFASNDCTGPELYQAESNLIRGATVAGTTAYYGPVTGVNTTINSFLYRNYPIPIVDQTSCDANFGPGLTTFTAPDGCCQVVALSLEVGPVNTVDLSAFVPPFSVQ